MVTLSLILLALVTVGVTLAALAALDACGWLGWCFMGDVIEACLKALGLILKAMSE